MANGKPISFFKTAERLGDDIRKAYAVLSDSPLGKQIFVAVLRDALTEMDRPSNPFPPPEVDRDTPEGMGDLS